MTFAAEDPEQILSQDAEGRVLVKRERRESLLAAYDRSGMSGLKFAQYVGIKYSTRRTGSKARKNEQADSDFGIPVLIRSIGTKCGQSGIVSDTARRVPSKRDIASNVEHLHVELRLLELTIFFFRPLILTKSLQKF